MNFSDLVAQVINDSVREDMGFVSDGGDGRIPNAVFASTLYLHHLENFWKDIITVDVIFDNPTQYIQTLDRRVLKRFRSISYFRKWDPNYENEQLDPATLPPLFNGTSITNINLALKHLQIIDLGTGGIFDSYGTERQDVCYAAGDTIFIKSSTPLSQGKLGYYSSPFLDISNVGNSYHSWIADEYPWAIIYHAEASIFTTTGDLDRARELNRPAIPARGDPGGLVAQNVAILLQNNIEVGGR